MRLFEQLIASVGNDRTLRIGDLRMALDQPTLVVPNMHKLSMNFCSWDPFRAGHALLTTAFDGAVNVMDLRVPTEPLVRIAANTAERSAQSILKPAWTGWGQRIVTVDANRASFSVWSAQLGDHLATVDAPFGLRIAQVASHFTCQDHLFAITNDNSVIAMQNCPWELQYDD